MPLLVMLASLHAMDAHVRQQQICIVPQDAYRAAVNVKIKISFLFLLSEAIVVEQSLTS